MEVGERRTEIVMEREIIQKLSCRWGCGVFLPVMDESLVKTGVSKERNHQIPAHRISQQV